eukprot:TRINITY_DN65329_c0_g1_i1.p1 TRINITY_DN65329_c0_g1~~TRINITY_DN65329_c0_g1_i1.p1  ORF type:complete len:153 (-),score=9.24 TRINITY_DN65329_c0_g1_i1:67-525(-)
MTSIETKKPEVDDVASSAFDWVCSDTQPKQVYVEEFASLLDEDETAWNDKNNGTIRTNDMGPVPSLGSQGHFWGICKPCAFIHTKGCASGENCTFCHLCPFGTKKTRKKIRKVIRWAEQANAYQNWQVPVPCYAVADVDPSSPAYVVPSIQY